MPSPRKYIVGRETITEILSDFVTLSDKFILNIYGPGGIGKTEACHKISAYCQNERWLHAFVQLDEPSSTFDRVLYNLKTTLFNSKSVPKGSTEFFEEFEKKFSEYLIIKEILREGGISGLFDAIGNIVPDVLSKAITAVGKTVTEEVKLYFRNQYALEEYINGAEAWLTKSFADGLSKVRASSTRPIILVIDTYEKTGHLDDWFCSKLIRMIPEGVRVVISGRDRIQDMSFHWVEYGDQTISYELPEVDRLSALGFYEHFGLKDPPLLEATYNFTGGYPLCMMLALDLARESGWEQLAGFAGQADKYQVARRLLDRLLAQQGVEEVREFLEKGVVTLWFDPEAIAYLLQIPADKAEDIYNRISKFSFTEKTAFGLKFHDRVREILIERLKYMDRKAYEDLLSKWRNYYKGKIEQEWLEN